MFKTLINELKRANDIREKELDLKILDQFDFQKKWKVWPKQEVMTPQMVVAPTYKQVSTSAQHPMAGNPFVEYK
tara:strand:+ start:519 stop:740 length:222 start_codon:yes stop_codon:yes gene_type:complete